ncbi:hypothetical protein C9374_003489 [Naegleria lovaniensis]|uniref:Uncharacterized protein n=1 Tax=Naegleria lovaniensis TaxID=51637 RepID=A0AA88KLB7_NAELO|nr:uncharacterized protein C9374_003489 [Naegleria lovaniensis]KAG2385674.1 hypothetical protein C9374_003489 [Naegleria lovaniensis]
MDEHDPMNDHSEPFSPHDEAFSDIMQDDYYDDTEDERASSSSSSNHIHTLGDLKQVLLQHVREECPAACSNKHDDLPKTLFFDEEKIRAVYIFGSQTYNCTKIEGVVDGKLSSKDPFSNRGGRYGISPRGETHVRVLSNDKKSELKYLASSDFDVLIVCDDLYSTDSSLGSYSSDQQFKWETGLCLNFEDGCETAFLEFDISFYNTSYFVSYMNYHQPVYIQSVTNKYWEDVFVIFEDEKMKYFRSTWCDWNMSIPRLKVAFSTELDYCFEKAQRFWNMSKGETDELKYNDNYNRYTTSRTTEQLRKTSKKNICHGLRKLRFAYQYLANGKIVDMQESNNLVQEVFDTTHYYSQWSQFETTYIPIYDENKLQFQTVCENIIGVAESLLTNYDHQSVHQSLAFLTFLNRYCTKDNQEGRKIVNECMRSTQALTQQDQECVQNSVGYLFNDVHSLTKLFNIDVLPFELACETITPQHLSQCTTFQLSLNPSMFYLGYDRQICNEVLQCDGAIIEHVGSTSFKLLCAPRLFVPDIRDQPELTYNCPSVKCFKLPYGDKVSLFFYRNNWVIACPEIERTNWKQWVLLQPSSSVTWRDAFWSMWDHLKMELPKDQMQDKTFHFVWNKQNGITLVSARVHQTCQFLSHSEMTLLCEQLHWKALEPMKELDGNATSSSNLWNQALEKSASLDPTIYEGFIFLPNDVLHASNGPLLQVKTPIHYLMPKLNITNPFYSGTEVLNSSVFEQPDESLVRSEMNDQALFYTAVMHNHELTTQIQQVIQQRNPLFLDIYKQFVEYLDKYFMEHPSIDDHVNTKQYFREQFIARFLGYQEVVDPFHEMVLDIIYEI